MLSSIFVYKGITGLGMEVVCGVERGLTELSWTQAGHAVADKYSLVE